jgi:hypothetical protein
MEFGLCSGKMALFKERDMYSSYYNYFAIALFLPLTFSHCLLAG